MKQILRRWAQLSFMVPSPGDEPSPELEIFEEAPSKQKMRMLGELIGLRFAAETLLKEILLYHASDRLRFERPPPRDRSEGGDLPITCDHEVFSLEEEGEVLYHTISISGPHINASDQHVFINWDFSRDQHFSLDFPLRDVSDPGWEGTLRKQKKARDKAKKQEEKALAAKEVEREKALLLQLHLKHPGVLRNY